MSIMNDISWVPALRTPFLNEFFDAVTLVGYPLFLILFLAFGYFFFRSKSFYHAAILLIGAGLLNSLLKDIYQDPRPAAEFALDSRTGHSYGWPSGHAQIAVVLWGFLAYEIRQKWASLAAVIIIALICASRVYLGVHDVGDVLGGLVIGTVCLVFYIWAINHQGLRALAAQIGDRGVLLALLAVHIIYLMFYPSHAQHEAPVWFVGTMLGWVAARSLMRQQEVDLPGPIAVQFLIASAATAIAFALMLATTRLPASMAINEQIAMPVNYAFGVIYVFLQSWGMPRLIGFFSRR